ncbi:tetratricopeptide repeat protein [Enhygromyxa salina]|uniref:tetratricopeptide repeat protein n=1 Tax=Enhygromyxa salina TaxID=215803 RepID=UPI000D086E7C|nr:tetratricopeptide repeat protein [Enhygromyxa salina]
MRLPYASVSVLAMLLVLGCEPKPQPQPPEPEPASEQAVCAGADALTEVWSPVRRTELDAALNQVPGEWPRQVIETIDARVAARGEAWRGTYVRACEQHDRRTQRCLDAQLWELDAMVALATDDPAWAASVWAELDAILRDTEACEGRQEPSFDAPALPRSVGRRWRALQLLLNTSSQAAVTETLRDIEANETVRETPAYALPLAAIRAVEALNEGKLDEAAAALDQAEALAATLGARAQVSVAHIRAVMAWTKGEVEAGVQAVEQAVEAAREQEDPWLVFTALRNLGRVKIQLGDHVGAVGPLTEAVSLSTRLAGPENPHTAEVQTSLAEAQLGLGQVEAAYDLLTQARDSFVNTLGPDHPQTLAAVEAIGRLFVVAGRPGDALSAYMDLLEVYGELYGPKDWRTAQVKLELGDLLMAMDQHDGAWRMYTEALTPLVQGLGPAHRMSIRAMIHLGIAEFALGNLDQAEVLCTRGSDLVKALPEADPLHAEVEMCVSQLAKARKPGSR